MSLGNGDSAAGTSYQTLVFTNTSDHPCKLQGHPGVSFVAGSGGKQVGASAQREKPVGSGAMLRPGATASADLGFTQIHNFDPNECKPTKVRGLRVYPPGERASVFVSDARTGCAGKTPSPQLTIGPVK